MDVQGALFAAVGSLAGVIGVMWVTLQREIARARQGCEEDRRKLWELVRVVSQLERRRDSPLFDARAPVDQDEYGHEPR